MVAEGVGGVEAAEVEAAFDMPTDLFNYFSSFCFHATYTFHQLYLVLHISFSHLSVLP